MKKIKLYEANDKLISLIRDNYNVLQSLGAFGINLGFGEKTVLEVCQEQNVDTNTFLAVVNLALNGYHSKENTASLSVPTLMKYLRASHEYYLDFQLPFIRRELTDALDESNSISLLILRIYDDYARSIQQHMKCEERLLFPYVETLLSGDVMEGCNAETFSKHHGDISNKLKELKDIIIKFLPADRLRNNKLTACLYDIYNNEEWLRLHSLVEDEIFIPAVRLLEEKTKTSSVNSKISTILSPEQEKAEQLSERERDVIIGVVQGMSNKEIADHLFISTNTVITHRRNIARKLDIHSPAGLTIYAIVNGIVSLDDIKL